MITNKNLEDARQYGASYAHNYEEPEDNIWEDLDAQEIILIITGEKIQPNTEEGQLILDNVEDGYYDEF